MVLCTNRSASIFFIFGNVCAIATYCCLTSMSKNRDWNVTFVVVCEWIIRCFAFRSVVCLLQLQKNLWLHGMHRYCVAPGRSSITINVLLQTWQYNKRLAYWIINALGHNIDEQQNNKTPLYVCVCITYHIFMDQLKT